MEREIINMPIGDIKPYEGAHDIAPSIEPLKKSIAEFGIQQPILIDKTSTIVAGNAIYKACVALGYTEVPVVVLAELTDEQVKAYRIADNKTSEFARWNEDKLKKELSFLDNPTSLQFCFDEDLSKFFKPITPQKPASLTETEQSAETINPHSTPDTLQATSVNTAPTATPTDAPTVEEAQEFREELQQISKSREVKQQQYVEHVCSKCGKKIIINI